MTTVENAEIYISPDINLVELNVFSLPSTLTNLQSYQVLDETDCGETPNSLEASEEASDFYDCRIVEETNNSATLNNEPQIK
ncbi:hypothetical protein PUN28_020766 [Cardiocondyla obscurior]|uniref:Uncharacterized protein n=1 Tax=Cardiocondyla obscurior TaxID=286306 RepID=A0AAW2E973_9HYME